MRQLEVVASQHPYYKFNYAWTRQMQDVVCLAFLMHVRNSWLMWMQCYSILLCGYLGGFGKPASGQLLTIEEVGGLMGGEFNVYWG